MALRNLKQEGINQLVDPKHASKALSTDLVDLAKEVQKVCLVISIMVMHEA